jgi:hypothetical protein
MYIFFGIIKRLRRSQDKADGKMPNDQQPGQDMLVAGSGGLVTQGAILKCDYYLRRFKVYSDQNWHHMAAIYINFDIKGRQR